jgi:hypothetical protein
MPDNASSSPVILGLGVLLWLYITVLGMFILISLCCCLKRSKTAPVIGPNSEEDNYQHQHYISDDNL